MSGVLTPVLAHVLSARLRHHVIYDLQSSVRRVNTEHGWLSNTATCCTFAQSHDHPEGLAEMFTAITSRDKSERTWNKRGDVWHVSQAEDTSTVGIGSHKHLSHEHFWMDLICEKRQIFFSVFLEFPYTLQTHETAKQQRHSWQKMYSPFSFFFCLFMREREKNKLDISAY